MIHFCCDKAYNTDITQKALRSLQMPYENIHFRTVSNSHIYSIKADPATQTNSGPTAINTVQLEVARSP